MPPVRSPDPDQIDVDLLDQIGGTYPAHWYYIPIYSEHGKQKDRALRQKATFAPEDVLRAIRRGILLMNVFKQENRGAAFFPMPEIDRKVFCCQLADKNVDSVCEDIFFEKKDDPKVRAAKIAKQKDINRLRDNTYDSLPRYIVSIVYRELNLIEILGMETYVKQTLKQAASYAAAQEAITRRFELIFKKEKDLVAEDPQPETDTSTARRPPNSSKSSSDRRRNWARGKSA